MTKSIRRTAGYSKCFKDFLLLPAVRTYVLSLLWIIIVILGVLLFCCYCCRCYIYVYVCILYIHMSTYKHTNLCRKYYEKKCETMHYFDIGESFTFIFGFFGALKVQWS